MLYMCIHKRIYIIFNILVYNTDKIWYTLYRIYIVYNSINDIRDSIWYLISNTYNIYIYYLM